MCVCLGFFLLHTENQLGSSIALVSHCFSTGSFQCGTSHSLAIHLFIPLQACTPFDDFDLMNKVKLNTPAMHDTDMVTETRTT